MLFPYRIDIERKSFSYVTAALIAINIWIFLYVWYSSDPAVVFKQYGLVPGDFAAYTLVTSLFLHGDHLHLVGNMWFLWVFGSNLEDAVGKWIYIGFYLTGGVLGDVMHAFWVGEAAKQVPCIGASGAISAILGAYAVLYPKSRVRCIWFFALKPTFIAFSAFLFVGVWFLLQLLSASFADPALSGVAYWAHIGGFLFGAVFMAGYKALMDMPAPPSAHLRRAFEESAPPENPAVPEAAFPQADDEPGEPDAVFDDYREDIEAQLNSGEHDPALESYIALEEKGISGSLSKEHQKAIAETLLSRGRPLLATRAVVRLLMATDDPMEASKLRVFLGLMLIEALGNKVEGRRLLEQSLRNMPSPGDEKLRVQAESVIESLDNSMNRLFPSEQHKPSGQGRYAVVLTPTRGASLDRATLFRALSMIGWVGELNVGAKLAYAADNNVKDDKDIVLEDLTFDEAVLVDRALEENRLPLIVLDRNHLINTSGFIAIEKADVDSKGGVIHLVSDLGMTCTLRQQEIVYMATFAMATVVEQKVERKEMRGKLDIELGLGKQLYDHSVGMSHDYIFDIYTTDSRLYRVSPAAFATIGKSAMAGGGKRFREFVSKATGLADPACLDESVFLFLTGCHDNHVDAYDVRGFETRSRRRARLAYIWRQADSLNTTS